MINAHANLHKRKSSLIADGNHAAAFKTLRKGTYMDSLERKDDTVVDDNNNNEEKDGGEVVDDEKKKPSTRCFSHGFHLMEGEMNHGMEDYVFAQHRKLNGYDLGLYAIFDGHAGRDVAKYLQNHLFEIILNEPDF
ncbi:unnamed protein product [Lathyrus sativus]|nr:unnamed protein product [Lathyrus sativus]